MLLGNLQWVSAMTYRTTFFASLSAVALFLAAASASADPGAARGAGVAPRASGFSVVPAITQHHRRGSGFFPGTGGVFYGLPE